MQAGDSNTQHEAVDATILHAEPSQGASTPRSPGAAAEEEGWGFDEPLSPAVQQPEAAEPGPAPAEQEQADASSRGIPFQSLEAEGWGFDGPSPAHTPTAASPLPTAPSASALSKPDNEAQELSPQAADGWGFEEGLSPASTPTSPAAAVSPGHSPRHAQQAQHTGPLALLRESVSQADSTDGWNADLQDMPDAQPVEQDAQQQQAAGLAAQQASVSAEQHSRAPRLAYLHACWHALCCKACGRAPLHLLVWLDRAEAEQLLTSHEAEGLVSHAAAAGVHSVWHTLAHDRQDAAKMR